MHVLLKYSLHPLQLLFESGVYFIQHAWRCGYCLRAATNREWHLIEQIRYIHCYVEQVNQMIKLITCVAIVEIFLTDIAPDMTLCLSMGFLTSPRLATLLLTLFLYFIPVSLNSLYIREEGSQRRQLGLLHAHALV